MSLPSSVPWRVCDRCGLGHAAGAACERKASPDVAREALDVMRRAIATPPERYVPTIEEAS